MIKGLFWLVTLLFLATGTFAEAQQTGTVVRIGYLDSGTASGSAVLLDAFRQELAKLGWVEGKNITVEYRFAQQKLERLPGLAAELVRLKVDLIVVTATAAAVAAKSTSSVTPIVIANASDPVGAGLVASLAQPGGNVTGLSGLAVELNTKRLEILKDAIPKLTRVGFLRQPEAAIGIDLQLKELRPAAQALNLKLEEIETPADAKGFESAFQT